MIFGRCDQIYRFGICDFIRRFLLCAVEECCLIEDLPRHYFYVYIGRYSTISTVIIVWLGYVFEGASKAIEDFTTNRLILSLVIF